VAGVSLPDDLVILAVDATIVVAHSEKENARATFKRTFGFHPIGVWCDNTAELLARTLRPGNANANTTSDHIDVLTAAIAQLPAGNRHRLLVRTDGAGASHELLDWLTGLDANRGRTVDYSVGFPLRQSFGSHADDLDPGIRLEGLGVRRAQALVGNQDVDRVEVRVTEHRVSPELGVIGQEHG
jgi:hypothetical protein